MTLTIDEQGRVFNEAGMLAMAYSRHGEPLVLSKYKFIMKRNISLAFVDPVDEGQLLTRRGGCCGGKQNLFGHASETNTRRWMGLI